MTAVELPPPGLDAPSAASFAEAHAVVERHRQAPWLEQVCAQVLAVRVDANRSSAPVVELVEPMRDARGENDSKNLRRGSDTLPPPAGGPVEGHQSSQEMPDRRATASWYDDDPLTESELDQHEEKGHDTPDGELARVASEVRKLSASPPDPSAPPAPPPAVTASSSDRAELRSCFRLLLERRLPVVAVSFVTGQRYSAVGFRQRLQRQVAEFKRLNAELLDTQSLTLLAMDVDPPPLAPAVHDVRLLQQQYDAYNMAAAQVYRARRRAVPDAQLPLSEDHDR